MFYILILCQGDPRKSKKTTQGTVVKRFFLVLLLQQCMVFGEAGKRGSSSLSWAPSITNPPREENSTWPSFTHRRSCCTQTAGTDFRQGCSRLTCTAQGSWLREKGTDNTWQVLKGNQNSCCCLLQFHIAKLSNCIFKEFKHYKGLGLRACSMCLFCIHT